MRLEIVQIVESGDEAEGDLGLEVVGGCGRLWEVVEVGGGRGARVI